MEDVSIGEILHVYSALRATDAAFVPSKVKHECA
jgi:hypothetical protein